MFSTYLKDLRTKSGKTQAEIAEVLGCNRIAVSNWEQGKNLPDPKKLPELADILGVPVGEMMREAYPDSGVSYQESLPAQPPGDSRLPIRRALFKLSAGVSGYEVEYENGESEPIFMGKRWFEQNHYRADKLLAVRVNGRSMEPSLHDGDLVIVNTEDVALKDGEVFAANFDGELVIKRLKRDASQWYLASDNQDKIRFSDKLCDEGCGLIGRIVYKQSEHI